MDYHHAPEQHFPVQRDEVIATVSWLRANEKSLALDATRLALAGESAGANLSAVVAAKLNAVSPGTVKALALFYGNFELPDESSRAYSQWVWGNYLGTPLHEAPHDAMPLRADGSVLPPAWLGVGELDPLLDDSLQMAEKLKAAQVPCEVVRYPGVQHAFVMVNRLYDGTRMAISDAAASLKRHLYR